MRRNKALEDELMRLKETMGVSSHIVNGAAAGPPPNTSPYSSTPGTASSAGTSAATSSMEIDTFGVLEGAPSLTSSPFTVYDDAGPNSTRGSPFPGSGYDGSISDYGAASSFVPLPDNASNADGSNWPPVPNAIPSTVSSPSSSVDDYTTTGGAPYMPTSMPNGMIPSANGVVKMEFDDGDRDIGFPQHLNNDLLQLQLQHHQQQAAMLVHSNNSSNMSSPDQPPRSMPWVAAPNMFPMFYPQQQSPVH